MPEFEFRSREPYETEAVEFLKEAGVWLSDEWGLFKTENNPRNIGRTPMTALAEVICRHAFGRCHTKEHITKAVHATVGIKNKPVLEEK